MWPYQLFRRHTVNMDGIKVREREGVSFRNHPPPPHGPPGVCEGSESFALFWARDGKVFKLRIAAGDMTVSRLSRAFQAIHIVFTFRVLQNRPMT